MLEDHSKDTPAEVVTTIVVIDTVNKKILPVLSGADFYATPRVSPDGKRLAWIQWAHPDMPWEGGEIHVGDITIGLDNAVEIQGHVHIAGCLGKVSAGYPSWANSDTLIFTSDESGYVNPWKYNQGKATPLFPRLLLEDFAEPFWVLNWLPYAVIDEEGKKGLFSALRDGRNILYLIDLDGNEEPKLLETPFVVINNLRTSSRKNKEIVFTGRKTNEETSLVACRLSSLHKLDITILKSSPWMTIDGVEIPVNIVSEPQPITLTAPEGGPLYAVYYPPHNPNYSGSSTEGEKPPCIVDVHGGPTHYTGQGLNWRKQYFTSRGWAWYVEITLAPRLMTLITCFR